MKRCIPLEKAAEQVCMENSKPPLIFQLPPERGRAILDAAQDSPVYKYPADVTGLEVDTGRWGRIRVYVLIPEGAGDPADVILYMHGAGWVFWQPAHPRQAGAGASRSHPVGGGVPGIQLVA